MSDAYSFGGPSFGANPWDFGAGGGGAGLGGMMPGSPLDSLMDPPPGAGGGGMGMQLPPPVPMQAGLPPGAGPPMPIPPRPPVTTPAPLPTAMGPEMSTPESMVPQPPPPAQVGTPFPMPSGAGAGGATVGDVAGMGMPGGPAPLGQSLEPTPPSTATREHVNPIDGGGGASAGPTDIRSAAQKSGAGGKAAGKPDAGKDQTQDRLKKIGEFLKAIQPTQRDVVKPTTPALPRELAMPASTIGQMAGLGGGAAPQAVQLYLSKLLGR